MGIYKSLLFRNIRELGGSFIGGFIGGMLNTIDRYYMPFPVFGSVSLVGGGALSVLDNYIPGDRPFLHSLYLGFYSNGSSMLGDKLLDYILSKISGNIYNQNSGMYNISNDVLNELLYSIQTQNNVLNNLNNNISNINIVPDINKDVYVLCNNETISSGGSFDGNDVTINNGGVLSILVSKNDVTTKKLKIGVYIKDQSSGDYSLISNSYIDEENNDYYGDNDNLYINTGVIISSDSILKVVINDNGSSDDRSVTVKAYILYNSAYTS